MFESVLSRLFSVLLCLGYAETSFGQSLELVSRQEIGTAYTNLELSLYRTGLTGGAGAIASAGETLWLATPEGCFFKIAQEQINRSTIPCIELGHEAFKAQRTYSYYEKSPRLLSLAIDGGKAFVAYDRFSMADNRIHFGLSTIELSNTAAGWSPFYESPPIDANYYAMGAGGRIALRGNTLAVTVGDYSLDRKNNIRSDFASQNMDLPFGKVIAFDRTAGPGKPYKILSLGLRNALGLTYVGDTLFASENGPRGGDRLLKLDRPRNYGWPYVTLGKSYVSYKDFSDVPPPKGDTCRPKAALSCQPFSSGFFAFVPSIAPTSLIEIKRFFNGWRGDILLASLKAQTLFRIVVQADRVLYVEPIPIGHRIRDLAEHGDSIYLWLDSGHLMKIERNDSNFLNAPANLIACSICHNVGRSTDTQTKAAPSLVGVVGRRIASEGYPYSEALARRQNEFWTPDNLKAFLGSPSAFAPGTTMPALALSYTPREIDEIIKQLSEGAR